LEKLVWQEVLYQGVSLLTPQESQKLCGLQPLRGAPQLCTAGLPTRTCVSIPKEKLAWQKVLCQSTTKQALEKLVWQEVLYQGVSLLTP
jgi:hypothetical protein